MPCLPMTFLPGPDHQQRVEAARRQIRELDTSAIKILLAFGTQLIDLRDAAAFAATHIPGARRVEREVLLAQAASLLPEPDASVVLVSASGATSAIASLALQNLGYTAVVSLRGGLRQWSGPLQGERAAAT